MAAGGGRLGFLTGTERAGVLFLAVALVLGQAVGLWRLAFGVRYRFRESDLRFMAAVSRQAGEERRLALAARELTLYVDPNTAGREDLETLPGVGPVIAGRIIERRRREPFAVPGDLLSVPGIGPKTLERMLPRLRIGAGSS